MNIKNLLAWLSITTAYLIQAAPVVQKVANKSQIGFLVVFHSDTSPCSLSKKNKMIDAQDMLVDDFLLEPSVNVNANATQDVSGHALAGKASLILRPAYYYDLLTEQKMPLLNDGNAFDDEKVEAAYTAWRHSGKKRKFNNAQQWLEHWVGKDIIIVPDTLEASGYIMHLGRIHISNKQRDHGQWLSFARGVFSRLMVDVEIDQHDRKGIIPTIKVTAGEGGICKSGVVDRI